MFEAYADRRPSKRLPVREPGRTLATRPPEPGKSEQQALDLFAAAAPDRSGCGVDGRFQLLHWPEDGA